MFYLNRKLPHILSACPDSKEWWLQAHNLTVSRAVKIGPWSHQIILGPESGRSIVYNKKQIVEYSRFFLGKRIRNKLITVHTKLNYPFWGESDYKQFIFTNTADILRKLGETAFPPNVLITSIDVVSMYTNVRQTEAINCVCNALDLNHHPYSITKPPSNYIRKLLELIIGRNCFQFGNNHYLQKIGCAMGSTASPEICDITLHNLEKQILEKADHIPTWWRYRDAILILYDSTLVNFKSLIQTMNQLHPTLKFTFEASDTSINYLDLTIFKGTRFKEIGILDTKVYTKPTEAYQYLPKTSSHPWRVFKAFIYGETLRYARNTNNEDDFLIKVNNFSEKLITRGYNISEINKIVGKVPHSERSKLIHKRPQKQKSTTPLVLSTTYNPYINHGDLNKAINKHWSLIQCNNTLSRIFPEPPVIAFRKDLNIRESWLKLN